MFDSANPHSSIKHSVKLQGCGLQPLRSAHTRGIVPATSPCNWSPEEFTQKDWLQGLVPQTVHTKRFEKQVAGICPKNSHWFQIQS